LKDCSAIPASADYRESARAERRRPTGEPFSSQRPKHEQPKARVLDRVQQLSET